MAARLQYSNAALVGNWYEDRLDSSHAPIPELERTGKFRVTPLKMRDGPNDPDDYVSTSHAFHQAQRPVVAPPKPQMICRETLPLATSEEGTRLPPRGSRPHGFGSVRPRHEPGHDLRRLETTTHSAFGGKYADTPEKRAAGELQDTSSSFGASMSLGGLHSGQPAGRVLRDNEPRGIRTATGGAATDERLQVAERDDPKVHTFVQRTWLGHDSHAQYVLGAEQYAAQREDMAARAVTYAVPGLGPAAQAGPTRAELAAQGHKFYKRNDTLRRDQGIWSDC